MAYRPIAAHHQQTGTLARNRGPEGNQILWKLEIEKVCPHLVLLFYWRGKAQGSIGAATALERHQPIVTIGTFTLSNGPDTRYKSPVHSWLLDARGTQPVLGAGFSASGDDWMSTATIDAVHAWQTTRQMRRVRHALRLLVLALADALAFVVTAAIFRWGHQVPALVFFQGTPPHDVAIQIDVYVVLAGLFIVTRYLAGDYSRRLLFWDGARLTSKALLITSIPDIFLLAAGHEIYSPFSILGSWLFLTVAVPVFRQGARKALSSLGLWSIPSALIGDGSRSQEIYNALSTSLSLGFELRAIMNTDSSHAPLRHLSRLEHGVVSNPQEAVHRVLQSGCEQAVIAAEDMQNSLFADITQAFLEADIGVAIIPSLRRLPLAGLTTSLFFGKDIMLLQVRNNSRQLSKRFAKRSFDIFGSIGLLAVLSPLFAAVALSIKRHDGGPVFYAHKRIGRGGHAFGCLKFRTMAVDADARLARWKVENPALYEEFLQTFKLRDDPRVTGPGKWLRRTSLDELPQLINVLRGEMSLVGPRPVVERELKEYYGPAAQLYSRVRPGMTGLWQVSGRSNTSYSERVTYDEWYILNRTFWYDMVILLQTAWIVVTGKGAF